MVKEKTLVLEIKENVKLVNDMSMVSRWTPAQKELAMNIVNDIAEDIDDGETRRELRQSLAIYADMLYDALQSKSEEKMVELSKSLDRLEILMKSDDHA